MKNLAKIISGFLLLFCISSVKAQTTCGTAVSVSYPINQTVTSYTSSAYWFTTSFSAGLYDITVTTTHGSTGKFTMADVYKTDCSTYIRTDSLLSGTDSTFTIHINDTAAATYIIKLYNIGGSSNLQLKTAASTSVIVVGDIGYCPGQQVKITAFPITPNGPQTYTWTTSGSTGVSGTNSVTVSATPTVSPTTYTLTYHDNNGTVTYTVSIFALPAAMCTSCEMVQNGSFESDQWYHSNLSNIIWPSACTINGTFTGLSDPKSWVDPSCGSSDYFNKLFPNTINGVPVNNHATNTPAHNGNAYAGFATYIGGNVLPNYREYIQAPLKCALVTGQLYNVSFYTSLSSMAPYNVPANNIGAYLSTSAVGSTSTTQLNYTPQINANSVINNAGSWTQVSGSLTGAGEQYITLGNFYDDVHTQPWPNAGYSYYFVDDISVTPATPTLTASSCQSGSVTITAAGVPNSTITVWSGPGSYTATGSSITVASPTAAVTYTCTVKLNTGAGCSNCTDLTATITINPTYACSGISCITPTASSTFSSAPAYAASNITVGSGISWTISSTDLRMAAGTSITVAAGGTLTIAGSWIHACNTCTNTSMWNGIVLNSGGTLIMTTAGTIFTGLKYNIIEDAVKAVSTVSSASATPVPVWSIESTIFNNNTKDIYIDAHPGDLSGNDIQTCIFTCRNLNSHSVGLSNFTSILNDILATTPLHPSSLNPADLTIAGARTTHGVYLNSVSNYTAPVSVGISGGAQNVFDNMDCGIYAYQSSLTSRTNYFLNLTGNITDLTGIGIYSDAAPTFTATTGVKAVLTVGNTGTTTVTGESNTFKNCLAGVYTHNMREVYINNNTFNNETTATTYTTTGTHVTGGYGVYQSGFATSASTTDFENLIFANNNIQNCANGHLLTFKKLFNTASNSLYFINNTITASAPNFCNYGLLFGQGSLGADASVPKDALNVTANTITNININAIFVQNVTLVSTQKYGYTQIYNNDELSVKYNSSYTTLQSPRVAAISLSNANFVRVTYNTNIRLTGFSGSSVPSAQYHGGVYLNGSNHCTINCNTVSNTGEDFVFEGNCATNGDYPGWQKNSMDYSKYGLVLRTSGILGNQGTISYPIDDTWGASGHFTDQTLADNSDPSTGTTSKLYTQGSGVYVPTTNSGVNTPFLAYSTGGVTPTLITVSSGTNTLICGAAGTEDRVSSNSLVQDQGAGDSLYFQNVLNSINDTSYHYPAYDSETRWGLQYMISSIYSDWQPAQGFDNAKTLALADAALVDTDYSTAQSLINSFSADNVIESNWQSVNAILIKQQTDTLNNNDIATLQGIAQQCPHSGGNVVWKARGILCDYYRIPIEYPNDCPINNSEDRTKSRAKINTSTTNNQTLLLYPNPNNGYMIIEYNVKDDGIFEITDINGNLVETYNLRSSNKKLEIRGDNLNNGVYFYRLLSKEILTGKIFILK